MIFKHSEFGAQTLLKEILTHCGRKHHTYQINIYVGGVLKK